MMLFPGIRLERGGRWNRLAFARDLPVLSSAPVGGGDVRARCVVNLCVDGPGAHTACEGPEATVAELAAVHGWPGRVVGFMTGVAAARLGVVPPGACGMTWAALATAGVSNAHRATDLASPRDEPAGAGVRRPGTINVIAVTRQGLTPAARAEALTLVAEAKASVLADLAITAAASEQIATGTGTDAVAIVAGDGEDTPFTGYHTASGRQLVAAVREAIRGSLRLGERMPP